MKTTLKTLITVAFLFNLQSAIYNQQSYIAFAQAPEIEWAKTYGGSGADRANSVQQTTDGGYIITGYTYSSQSGDVSGQNNGGADLWVVKTDASGNIEWEKNYGGSGNDMPSSVKQTTDGGYIVAGRSNSNDGDVGGNNGDVDMWVVKLDTNGIIEWEQNYGGSGVDFAGSIQQTTDGGYIVAGGSSSTNGDITGNNGGYDMWVVKLHANGNINWQKSLGGSSGDYAQSIQQTTDGGYIVAGYSNSSNGDVSGNHGGYDIWVVKLNSTGTIQWEQNYGGSGNDYARSIQQTTDGGYIIAGHSESNDGDVTENNGDYDFWVLKLNSTGNMEWQKSLGGSEPERANSIQQTIDGGYIVAGYSLSSDGDVGGNYGGNGDFWVVKLNTNGNIEWEQNYGGSGTDRAESVIQTTDGGYIVAGYTTSNDGDVSGNNGNNDAWVVKLESKLSVLDNTLPAVSFYPNPIKDMLYIQTEQEITAITLYSITGQRLQTWESQSSINLSAYASGSYFVQINTRDGVETKQVIKK